jgi:thioredoxin-related protein
MKMIKFFMLVMVPVFFLSVSVSTQASEKDKAPVVVGEDGLHKQPWFLESFLNLKEDVEEAAAAKKNYVIIWEQRGCPYCKRTHEVNFRIPKIVNLIKSKFTVVQLNLWGDREVTDFDGKVLKEKDLAQKWGVRFTPTIQFFPDDVKKIGAKAGNDAELVRVPGYFKPFHFYMLFRYVSTKGYDKEPNFQRWLIGEGDKLREQGVDINKALWSDKLEFD